MTPDTVSDIVDIAFVGLCLFCANLLVLRRRDPGVYVPLVLLFLFRGLSVLIYLVADMTGHTDQVSTFMRISVLFGLLDFSCPFLFWLYVRGLTSEGIVERIPKWRYHVIPIVVVSLLMISVTTLPEGLTEADLPQEGPAVVHLVLVGLAMLLADILFKIMIGTYLLLILLRLKGYRKRLREIFASTENRELTWVWAIMLAAGIYWVLSVILSASIWGEMFGIPENSELLNMFDSIAQFVLFWVVGIWGLRQRPGLMRTPMVEPPEPDPQPTQKYEKSALDQERAKRIAQKIETAMSKDMLYREPNLSLWDLAKHIGVTSHYVSQTLNTQLNSSFFDYINRWRIKDAVEQLNATDETILVIAYDVGFNSRSAFYKAFKRETGKTPSEMRK